MSSRSAIYRQQQKKKDPQKYQEYLQKQKDAAARRHAEMKRLWEESQLTRAQIDAHIAEVERKRKRDQERYFKKKNEKRRQTRQSTSASSSQSLSDISRKRPRDMDEDELREHRGKLKREQRRRYSHQKKAAVKAKDRMRKRQKSAQKRADVNVAVTPSTSSGALRQSLSHDDDEEEEEDTKLFICLEKLFSTTSSTSASGSGDAQADAEKPISRFPIPDVDTLPPDMQELMNETKEKAGFVPNVFKTLSHRPDEMRAFVHYYDAVMNGREDGHLTKADKELIIVAVSAHNNCRYCIIAHSALHRIFSKNRILADQVAANWETADLDERRKAILRFAMQVAVCKPLEDSHFDELYAQGLTKEDAWDIGAVVALFSLSNRMAYLTNMVPNEEFYMLGRVDKPKKS